MTLGERQAKIIAAARDAGDGLAGQDYRAERDRNGENAPGGRREYIAFGALLPDDGLVGLGGRQLVDGDIIGGLCLVELRLAGHALREKLLCPVEIGLGLHQLRIGLLRPRFGRLDLQRQLVVDDPADDGALGHHAAFGDVDGCNRAADPRASRNDGPALDLPEHRLHLGDGGGLDGELPGQGTLERRTEPKRGQDGNCGFWAERHFRTFYSMGRPGDARLAPGRRSQISERRRPA